MKEVMEMGKCELNCFMQELYVSKENMKPEVFKVFCDVSQLRDAYLSDNISTGTFVELSEGIGFD